MNLKTMYFGLQQTHKIWTDQHIYVTDSFFKNLTQTMHNNLNQFLRWIRRNLSRTKCEEMKNLCLINENISMEIARTSNILIETFSESWKSVLCRKCLDQHLIVRNTCYFHWNISLGQAQIFHFFTLCPRKTSASPPQKFIQIIMHSLCQILF
jgi:hypothetical protein